LAKQASFTSKSKRQRELQEYLAQLRFSGREVLRV
jgi:hypothetical protein